MLKIRFALYRSLSLERRFWISWRYEYIISSCVEKKPYLQKDPQDYPARTSPKSSLEFTYERTENLMLITKPLIR